MVAIDQFFPSSKRYSGCVYTMTKMALNVRSWICPECGANHDSDVNAAKNIKAVGLITLAHGVKWFTEFGHLNRGDMLTSEQHRCHNEKKKFQRRV